MLPDALRAARRRGRRARAVRDGRRGPASARLAQALAADYITFTSASSVRYFLQATARRRAGHRPARHRRNGRLTCGTCRTRASSRSDRSPARPCASTVCDRTSRRRSRHRRPRPGAARRRRRAGPLTAACPARSATRVAPAPDRLDQRPRARRLRSPARHTARSSPPRSRPPGAGVRDGAGRRRPAARCWPRSCCEAPRRRSCR